MKPLRIFVILLMLAAALTLSVQASDENFGEEDDFGDNFGQEDAFETESEGESVTQSGSADQVGQTTAAEKDTERESGSVTTRVEGEYPPSREQEWALPIPVIWGTIALVGICGTSLAVMYLIKFFKQ